jgi:DNA-binding transcriptional ArsR family regulator
MGTHCWRHGHRLSKAPAVSDQQTDAVFAALADPTRRRLLLQLAEEGPLTATQLAETYPVTRQAVVKHLGALSEAGVVQAQRQGREVQYEVRASSLQDAAAWLTEVEDQWDRRLGKLHKHFTKKN